MINNIITTLKARLPFTAGLTSLATVLFAGALIVSTAPLLKSRAIFMCYWRLKKFSFAIDKFAPPEAETPLALFCLK